MSTSYLTSDDGLAWTRHGTVLRARRPARWDARGARVTAVLSHDPLVVLYDGRATAEENWHETTGVARDDGDGRAASPTATAPVLRSPALRRRVPLRQRRARCPTGRPGSTSSWPGPTAPTTWSPTLSSRLTATRGAARLANESPARRGRSATSSNDSPVTSSSSSMSAQVRLQQQPRAAPA